MHSPDHSTKGTPSALGPPSGQWPLTAGEDRVSGSLSSPLRGAFHLSLTVLVHYRSLKVLSLGGWSPQLPTNSPGFVVLRIPAGSHRSSLERALTCSGHAFQHVGVDRLRSLCWSYNPSRSSKRLVWAPPVSLATTPLLRESRLISSRRATEMFQFTRCPPSLPMCSAGGLQTSLWRGCPIRILRAHRLHAAPPERFAGLRVLRRPSAPRHPPCPLCSLFSPTRWRGLPPPRGGVDVLVSSLFLCFGFANLLSAKSKLSFSIVQVQMGHPNT